MGAAKFSNDGAENPATGSEFVLRWSRVMSVRRCSHYVVPARVKKGAVVSAGEAIVESLLFVVPALLLYLIHYSAKEKVD